MGFGSDLFGSKPTVPVWNNITAGGSQTTAINENSTALPGLEKLATGVDAFNQDQLTQIFNSVMPGFSASATAAGKNIQSEISGQIPTDVSQAVQSSDAAQALTGGFGGSGLAGNMTAKDLGLTSLNLTNTGLSSLESWSGQIDKMFAPGQFNVSSMFVDPQQEFTDTMQNQEQSVSQQWMTNQVSAMPDPETVGLFKTVTGILGGMGGGGVSGGGGGGGM